MSSPWWMEVLACPACRAPMDGVQACSHCGATFGEEDGVPALLPPAGADREVSFRFPRSRSVKEDGAWEQVLRRPETSMPRKGLPYPMDPVHATELALLPAGARVLEIGCGGGQVRPWLTQRGVLYLGTDITRTRVWEWLQAFGGPDLLADAHWLPVRDGSFDAVYCCSTLEHLACPALAALEVHRVLKPGGKFLGSTAFSEPWHDASHSHLSPYGVLELLLDAELSPRAVFPSPGWDVFHSVPHEVFRGPLRWTALRLAGAMRAAYDLQEWARHKRARAKGRPVNPILSEAVISGAVQWVAERPA